jgi:hypothetical protein
MHLTKKVGLFINSKSCFIDNERHNKEYKSYDINDQLINQLNNYTEYLNYLW